MSDKIKQPNHYTWLPGIECYDVTKHFCFTLGNAIKYIWRAGKKGSESELDDLMKAREYLDLKIADLTPKETVTLNVWIQNHGFEPKEIRKADGSFRKGVVRLNCGAQTTQLGNLTWGFETLPEHAWIKDYMITGD